MAKDKARKGDETAGDKKGILLETGTNEFEIVEFSIGAVNYGINVAKVREVIQRAPVTAMPQAHPYIDGLFTLRGKAIPLVNLPRCLNVANGDDAKNIIVTEINNYDIGFLVENVSRIHRISWKDMEPAPEVGDQSRVVGIINFWTLKRLLRRLIPKLTPSSRQSKMPLPTFGQSARMFTSSLRRIRACCATCSSLRSTIRVIVSFATSVTARTLGNI